MDSSPSVSAALATLYRAVWLSPMNERNEAEESRPSTMWRRSSARDCCAFGEAPAEWIEFIAPQWNRRNLQPAPLNGNCGAAALRDDPAMERRDSRWKPCNRWRGIQANQPQCAARCRLGGLMEPPAMRHYLMEKDTFEMNNFCLCTAETVLSYWA